MAIPTQPVTCTAYDQNGNAVAGARLSFKLNATEIYQGFVAPEKIDVVADANGIVIVQLFPNALGTNGSLYQVTGTNPDTGKKFLNATAFVPNIPCNLHEILTNFPESPVGSAEQAAIDAAAARDAAAASAAAAHTDALSADADATQTAADRVQTGLDRIATGQDRVQTGQDRTAAATSATNAANSAAAAAAAVLAALLTGLSVATGGAIVSTDSVLVAFGKLQKQVTDAVATLTAHIGNTSNPHAVTKAQVGLANADNTSDVNKPVSTAQAAADTTVLNTAKSYADGLVVGLWDDRGNFDATPGTYPTTGGSGSAGAVLKGDIWTISVAGTVGGVPVAIRQTVRAMVDAPGQTAGNWAIGLANADIDDSITNGVTGRAPSQNAVFAGLAGKEPTVAAGTTAQFWRGDKAWTDFATTVRASVLTGLSTASAAVVTATDTVLVAIGKLTKQNGDMVISSQNSSASWLTTVAGTNTITAVLTPTLTAYVAGMAVRLIPAVTNSGATTLNINGLGANAITKNGTTALAGGELVAGQAYWLIRDGAGNWQISSGSAASGAVGGGSDKVFYENSPTVTTNYTLTTGKNAVMVGPLAVNTGVTLTVPTGQRLVVL